LKGNIQTWFLQASIGKSQTNLAWMTLQQWIQLAVQTDNTLYNAQGLGRSEQTGPNTRQTEYGKTANASGPGEYVQIDQKDIKKQKRNDRCIKCGRKGHHIHECRSNKWIPKLI